MKRWTTVFAGTTALVLLTIPALSMATDVDGPDDCTKTQTIEDWGDAPEGVLAYPGVIGKFPTCRAMNVFGTQEIAAGCSPVSTPPGFTGHIFHRQQFGEPRYWLGCYSDPTGRFGIDRESEGKMNQPATGNSFCDGGPTDCVETLAGLSFDQDECYGDGSDAGLLQRPTLVTCQSASIELTAFNCQGTPLTVFLNILIDFNHDGDWNDVELCAAKTGDRCAPEWVVKNSPIVLLPGCNPLNSAPFLVGPQPGPAWLRISLTNDPVTDDYPWVGSAGLSGFFGGETEDYPAIIEGLVPSIPSTWGRIKTLYE
jgi:hypothetical protein